MPTDKTKAKIQELCPDVMELKFGCEIGKEVLRGEHKGKFRKGMVIEMRSLLGVLHWAGNDVAKTELVEAYTNFGSPITLAVVLRAIGKEITGKKDEHGEPIQIEITSWGMFIGSYNWEETPAFWNLAQDNYDNQTRETQLFIGGLLGVEE